MDVVVFGAGSLGSLVGGLCAREHDVTLVGREPHVTRIRESGLTITGAMEFAVDPDARTTVPEHADLALVTVKSFDTRNAARALVGCTPGVVCSLQNGLGNEERLARHHDTVLAGTCTYGARLLKPGHVSCTGLGEVVVGSLDGPSPAAERVGKALRAAGIEGRVSDRMNDRRWEKLAVNAGVNPVTALAGVRNGALADGPLHEVATDAARETARVARENGIDLGSGEAVAALETVVKTTAENHSSMLQDVRASRRTEIDAINGAVVERARDPVPVNRTLARLVRVLTD